MARTRRKSPSAARRSSSAASAWACCTRCLSISLKGWKDTSNFEFGAPLKAGSIGAEISPELLGVGYIIGPRIAFTMAAGGVLSYLLLIPMIKFFGDLLTVPLSPGTMLIRDMTPKRHPQRVRAVHRRGRRRHRRPGLAGALDADHLERLEGRPGWHQNGKRRGGGRPAYRRRHPDEMGRHRLPRHHRRHHVRHAAAHEFARRAADPRIRLFVFHRVVAVDRPGRLVVEPDFRHGGGHAAVHLSDLPADGLDRRALLRHRAVGRRHRLHRGQQRRHHVAGFEDRLPGRLHAALPAVRDPGRRAGVGAGPGSHPAETERRRHRVRPGRAGRARHHRRCVDADRHDAAARPASGHGPQHV